MRDPAGRRSLDFRQKGYAIVRHFLGFRDANSLFAYTVKKCLSGQVRSTDDQVEHTPCAYADPAMELLLAAKRPVIESITSRPLLPTYSYLRLYKNGDKLERHRDRPACEISVTTCLGYASTRPWPIYVKGIGGQCRVELQPGDALIYRGVECEHWRNQFTGILHVQVFLHYVSADGPYASWQYDRRRNLNLGVA